MKPRGGEGTAVALMNKRVRDPLRGKEVLVTGGPWKGYRGKVTNVDDRQAIVEFSTICKKLPIDRNLIKDLSEVSKNENGTTHGDDEHTMGGRTVYEAGKTPMHNTPSYYPHSPAWGAANSPGFGTECKEILIIITIYRWWSDVSRVLKAW